MPRYREGRNPKAPANSADEPHHDAGHHTLAAGVDDTGDHDTLARLCSVNGCERPSQARDLCASHYQRWRKHGDPTAGRPLTSRRSGTTAEDRFWAKVDKTPGCWLWLGSTNTKGYGQFWFDGQMRKAHRVAYELGVGTIPEGLALDHRCHVRHCVRPEHLEPVTNAENGFRRKGADRGASSSWRGVSWYEGTKSWGARVTRYGKETWLGYFAEELDAARAAAEKYAELGDPKPLNDLLRYLSVVTPGEQLDLFGEAS